MGKFVIIGAGITGLCTAYYLQNDYIIYEKTNQIGGSAGSIQKDGFLFDYGEKFIRISNKEMEKIVNKLLGTNFFSQELNSVIFFKGKYISYPFQENLRELPIEELKLCAKSLILNYLNNKDIKKDSFENFQDYIFYQNGEYVANEFMIPYNEKIWATSPDKMNTNWFLGPNFIPSFNLDEILNSILPKSESIPAPKKIRWYPKKGGSQALADSFKPYVKNITYNQSVKKVDLTEKEIQLEDASIEKYKYLISTMPLKELLDIIEPLPDEILALKDQLEYNSVFCLNLCLDHSLEIPYHWIYFPQKEIPFSRLFFTQNFSENNVPSGKGACSALLTYRPEQEFDQATIEKQILESLIDLNVLKDENEIIDSIPLTVKYGFTIPTIGLPSTLTFIQNYLKKYNVITLGRYGEWKYSGIEHAFEDGLRIYNELIKRDKKEK